MARQSRSASTASTPLRTPSIDRIAASTPPASTRSTRSTRSNATPRPTSSATPTGDAHHHLTSDDLARLEAEKLLATPSSSRLRSGDSSGRDREMRHLHLLQARKSAQTTPRAGGHDNSDTEEDQSSRQEEDEDAGLTTATLDGDTVESASSNSIRSENADEDGDENANDADDVATPRNDQPQTGASGTSHVGAESDVETEGTGEVIDIELSEASAAIPQTASTATFRQAERLDEEEEEAGAGVSDAESSSSGSSSSDSDSDSDDSDSDSQTSASDEDDSDEDNVEDSDEEEERLDKLLQAARISAIAKQQDKADPKKSAEAGEVVLQFDEEKKEAPIPDITVSNLPRAHMSFAADGSAKAAPSESVLPKQKSKKGKEKAIAPELELDDRAYQRPMSKREKAAQPKKATPSELWAALPTARRDALQQMKRDYQALSLANTLDPKRFMKGGMKLNKVPENFAIGTIIEQPRHLQATTLRREAVYRPGQIVQDVARDEGINATAKRKYGDLEDRRMKNGRGRGWKKRTKW